MTTEQIDEIKFDPKELFNQLMNLMDIEDKPFFFEDTKINEEYSYRVFCYNIPGYMQYQLPFARETRGSMFLIKNDTKEFVSLVVLPMPKFFTYGEQPETEKLDLSKVKRFTLKVDGSLVSSYIDFNGDLAFKTKRSPSQDNFNELIESVLYFELKEELKELTKTHTVDCELTSPTNRVILEYKDTNLSVLKVRSRETGLFKEIHSEEFKNKYPHIAKIIVEELDIGLLDGLSKKNNNIDCKGIEGGVVEMSDGTLAKIKTRYYLTQNRFANLQDFKKRNRLMVEACIEETFDELRTLFFYRKRSENYDAEGIVADMDSVEKQVREIYNPLYSKIMGFYNENKELSLEEYTEKAKEEKMHEYMSLLVPLHKGLKVSIKGFFLKKYGNKIRA